MRGVGLLNSFQTLDLVRTCNRFGILNAVRLSDYIQTSATFRILKYFESGLQSVLLETMEPVHNFGDLWV